MHSQLELIILVLLLRAMVTGKIHKNGFVIQTKRWRIQKMDSSSNDESNE
jgi:predicted membrane protein